MSKCLVTNCAKDATHVIYFQGRGVGMRYCGEHTVMLTASDKDVIKEVKHGGTKRL